MTTRIHTKNSATSTPQRSTTPVRSRLSHSPVAESAESSPEFTPEEAKFHASGYSFAHVKSHENTPGVKQRKTADSLKVSTLPIQAKLTIGEPGDKYEQEADQIAAHVVRQMNVPQNQQPSQSQTVQRLPSQSSNNDKTVRMKPTVQPLSGEGSIVAAPELESSIQQARIGGQHLPESIRDPMEQAFGVDFSGVKIHADAQADRLNQSILSNAFTSKRDIFFRQGTYNPANRKGQKLIAHELTHVIQQNGAGLMRQTQKQRIGATIQPKQTPDSQIIQRKVGFEIEEGDWLCAKKLAPEKQDQTWLGNQNKDANVIDIQPRDHLITGNLVNNPNATNHNYRFATLKKKDPIVDGTAKSNGFKLEADESNVNSVTQYQGAFTNIEFVTQAFEDTKAGGKSLSKTMHTIVNMAESMLGLYQSPNRYINSSQLRKYGKAIKDTVVFPNKYIGGVMQVTAGIDLDRVATLMTHMGGVQPGESAQTIANLKEGRETFGKALNSSISNNPTGLASVRANEAIQHYRTTIDNFADTSVINHHWLATKRYDPKMELGSKKLQGIIALLVQYIVTANHSVLGYAKTIAPLMARTDFATLYKQLPDGEKEYLRENNSDRFVDLVMYAVNQASTPNVVAQNVDVFPLGIYNGLVGHHVIGINPMTLAGLTREDWLRGITNGTDYLTAANFNKNPVIRIGAPQPKKADLESLGSYGQAMESVGTNKTQAPIFEIRSMGKISHNYWYSTAMDIFRYLRELNDGTGVFYQDTFNQINPTKQAELLSNPSKAKDLARKNLKKQMESLLKP